MVRKGSLKVKRGLPEAKKALPEARKALLAARKAGEESKRKLACRGCGHLLSSAHGIRLAGRRFFTLERRAKISLSLSATIA